ncbi:putative methyl-CpG-binding domain protein 3-like 5 [Chionomys nivalis]|uniref:putative methyl-CpG-binding domain protein 3-like 5 n=1 Tax=Chionomys nivalis TaxID=269649 RepID=UPI0025985DA5|nr:putative methyl-CpG-binding domain protein 3-like 5 [Chionomys nivalis]
MEGPSGNSFPSQPLIGRLTRSIIPLKLQKRIQAVLNKDKSKRRGKVTSPMRMTSCIFKSSVTRITAHPENTTRHNRQEETLEKPQQLCAFRRLQEHHIEDEETVREAREQSPSISYSQGVTVPMALQLSPSVNLQQVTAADIRRQSRRVARARKRLAEALELDRLARQEENMEG